VILAMPDFIDHMRAVLESLREEMEWYEIPPPQEQDDWLMEKMKNEQ
jgi:hypothetical protein